MKVLYVVMWIFMSFVCALDIYITYEYREIFLNFEANPFQKYLMIQTRNIFVPMTVRFCSFVVGFMIIQISSFHEKHRNLSYLATILLFIVHVILCKKLIEFIGIILDA